MEKFKERLENNPRYRYGTVVSYNLAVSELIDRFGTQPTIEDLNRFITLKCNKRQPYVKYAIKEYLEMTDRMSEYHLLVQAKIRKPMKTKVFLSIEELNMVVAGIRNETHKAIAKLQIATAARAAEIITLERKNVKKENERIKLKVMGKGDKPDDLYLRLEMWPLLEPYMKEPKRYIFFSKEADQYNQDKLFKTTYTLYKRYLESLKIAAKKYNIELSTHDLRRSVANALGNPRVAQKVLRHSSSETTERYLKNDSQEISDALLEHQKSLTPD